MVSNELISFIIDIYLSDHERNYNMNVTNKIKFFSLLQQCFEVKENFNITKKIGEGSYGKIYETDDKQILKFIKNDKSLGGSQMLTFRKETLSKSSYLNSYYDEIATNIILSSVIKYLNDIYTLPIDYCTYFTKIHRPFIKCKKLEEFNIGFVMEKNENTLYNIIKGDNVNKKKDSLKKTFDLYKALKHLSVYGIYYSHRDSSTKNIMISNGEIKLIDFTFSQIRIVFQNRAIWTHGFFFSQNYSNTYRENYDIILLVLYICKFHKEFAEELDLYYYLSEAIDLDRNKQNVDLSIDENVWLYPFLAKLNEYKIESIYENMSLLLN